MSVPIKSMGKEVTAILSEHTHHSSPCPNKLNLIKGTTPMSFGAKTWPVFMFFVFVFENVFKCEIHKLYVSFCLYFFFFASHDVWGWKNVPTAQLTDASEAAAKELPHSCRTSQPHCQRFACKKRTATVHASFELVSTCFRAAFRPLSTISFFSSFSMRQKCQNRRKCFGWPRVSLPLVSSRSRVVTAMSSFISHCRRGDASVCCVVLCACLLFRHCF